MSAFAYNVTLEDFDARVIQPSLETPVLVDFWSPASAACQGLKPIPVSYTHLDVYKRQDLGGDIKTSAGIFSCLIESQQGDLREQI